MKNSIMKTPAGVAFCLVAACAIATAQTWTGGGADNNWNTAANWDPAAVPAAGGTLYFGGASDYTVNRNLTGETAAHFIFTKGADAYTFTGERLQLHNTSGASITNISGKTVTFESGLQFSHWSKSISTDHGDIVVQNGINPYSTAMPTKNGIGSLTIQGQTVAYTGTLTINAGSLILDGYAQNYGGEARVNMVGRNTAVIEFGGESTGTTTINKTLLDVQAGDGAASQIRLKANGGDGVTLNFNNGVDDDPAYSLSRFAPATFNVDLSSHAANSVTFAEVRDNPATQPVNGIFRWATVTDTTGTGFATMDGTSFVRNTTTSAFTPDTATSATTNYHIGSGVNVETGNRTVNSLTIHATTGGSLANDLTTEALLMREGSQNYTINGNIIQVGTSNREMFIHQYSTDGVLTLNGQVHRTNSGGTLIKAGPGTVEVGADGRVLQPGNTYVQGGKLVMNGEIERSANVRVFHAATLEGGGEIGTEAPSAVTIYAGGTLAGSTSAALDVTGTLALESYSTFAFTLGTGTDSVNISGAITLQDDVNLSLALVGEPVLEADIYLLKSGDAINGITGNFVYNNTLMTDGTAFTLNGQAFTYYQDNQNIWVQAIPEPSAALLFGLGTALLLLRRRRGIEKNHQTQNFKISKC